jgi:hypothetical protein
MSAASSKRSRSNPGELRAASEKVFIAEGLPQGEPTLPNQVLVWESQYVQEALRWLANRAWTRGEVYFAGNCLKETAPGNRAAIYESGVGIVGYFDFAGQARRRENQRWQYMAAGLYRPLDDAIVRDRLMRRGALMPKFSRLRGRSSLTAAEARALARIAKLPPFLEVSLPDWAREAKRPFRWDQNRVRDHNWAGEYDLQMRLARTPSLWRRLGMKRKPQLEVTSRDRQSRYDLVSFADRVVVEVEHRATMEAFEQAVRYLETVTREHRGRWRSLVVYGRSANSALRRAVASSPDEIELWRCESAVRRPRLEREI